MFTLVEGFVPNKEHPFGYSERVVEDYDGRRLYFSGESYGIDRAYVARAERLGAEYIIDLTDRVCSIKTPGKWFDPELLDSFGTWESVAQIEALSVPKKSSFVHLHIHSEFSSFDGFSTVDELVARAVAEGHQALAITDHGVCASHPELQAKADAAGIKPIYGIEAYFVDDRHRRPIGLQGKKSKDLTDDERQAYLRDNAETRDYWHLILWAQTDQGLRNLWAMSTEANAEGHHYKPRMDWDTLERHNEGVMASTACLNGPVAAALKVGDMDTARARLSRLHRIFGDRLYVELHTNTLPEQRKVNELLVQLAEEQGLPVIAVCDSHFSCSEHQDAHKVWITASASKKIDDETNLFDDNGGSYHYMSESEVRERLDYLPPTVVDAAIANTSEVANRISARITPRESLPIFSKRGGVDADRDLLFQICMENLERRTAGKTHSIDDYLQRFENEMLLLIQKKFCGYFLIVSDYCLWAKRRGILVGPGRGSGGGSLVAYLAGITEIDPVESDLLFALPPPFPPSQCQVVMDTAPFCGQKAGNQCMRACGTGAGRVGGVGGLGRARG